MHVYIYIHFSYVYMFIQCLTSSSLCQEEEPSPERPCPRAAQWLFKRIIVADSSGGSRDSSMGLPATSASNTACTAGKDAFKSRDRRESRSNSNSSI